MVLASARSVRTAVHPGWAAPESSRHTLPETLVAKGFFTQSACLLTDGTSQLQEVRAAMAQAGYSVTPRSPAASAWQFGGTSLVVPFRPEVNGYLAVDVVDQPWPDGMGDPATDPTTFAAWSMGHFGPLAFPGGLERAAQHAWAWPQGRAIAAGHRGFVRLRLSYAFGAGEDDLIMPSDCDPVAELLFLTQASLAAMRAPGVLAYFNPNGEVLRDPVGFDELWTACRLQDRLPLPLWMNIRLFNVTERLALMDTVGNGQLDLPDMEAVFPADQYEPGDVDYYLRNVTHYLLQLGGSPGSGESIDGPGETGQSWTTAALDRGAAPPPRPVLRLFPRRAAAEVRAALGG